MALSDEAAAAVAKLQKKQTSRAKWTKIGGVLLAVVFVARAADILFLQKPAMQSCDDSAVQQTLSDIIDKGLAKQGTAFKVKGFSNIQTGQRTDTKAECTATITLSDDSKGVVHYNVDPKQVFFEKVSEN